MGGGGNAMVVQRIWFVAVILCCLFKVIRQNNILLHVDDMGIMKIFAT
jgi:hypothetical protein